MNAAVTLAIGQVLHTGLANRPVGNNERRQCVLGAHRGRQGGYLKRQDEGRELHLLTGRS